MDNNLVRTMVSKGPADAREPARRYGLLRYPSFAGFYNIGDHIQSLAARQFLPRVDVLIDRERLGDYDGPPVRLILNGWFSHRPDTWVPSPAIIPHFVSFHMNARAADRMLSPAGIAYLQRHSPIGCRDWHTVALLRARNIDAYFSGCLTLTLTREQYGRPRGADAVLTDPFFNVPSPAEMVVAPSRLLAALVQGGIFRRHRLLQASVHATVRRQLAPVTHRIPEQRHTDETLFDVAALYLQRYARARLVLTSRLHCALPCLAFGTPVVFLDAFTRTSQTCRFDGLLDLLHRVTCRPDLPPVTSFDVRCPLRSEDIPDNPTNHFALAAALRRSCERFVAQ
jgi:hypothetical protein